MKQIKWSSKQVEVKKIKFTPKNYKIKTDLGKERLKQSLKLFGLAGNVVVNTDLTLIDGNSRVEEAVAAGDKKIWVSVPDRKLTPKEFNEMSAMYDFAKAGEVDIDSIQNDLGTREDFFRRWSMQIPPAMQERLAGMGKGATVKGVELEYPEEGEGTSGKEDKMSDVRMIQIYLQGQKQEDEFRAMEDTLAVRYKSTNITDTVLMAFRELTKTNSKKTATKKKK